MCGRFCQTQTGAAIATAFGLADVPAIVPRYNIAPSQQIGVIMQGSPGQGRRYCLHQWGLIPRWAKEATMGKRLINARSETAADKPSFREAFRSRRCLVVADGFYEWQRTPAEAGGKPASKQPFFVQMKAGTVFAFARLWEQWPDPATQQQINTCTILTTRPNRLMASIHNRMPVILPTQAHDAWLHPATSETTFLKSLLQPYPEDELMALPIGEQVNNPRNDFPAIQTPEHQIGSPWEQIPLFQ